MCGFAEQLAEEDGYCGQILMIVLGTNDALELHSKSDLATFEVKYRDFCLKLLAIPKLALMPCALLPRGY